MTYNHNNPETIRNHHSMLFQTHTAAAGTDIYKDSYFQQTIRDRNALPESVISSVEIADDCVAKSLLMSSN